MAGSDDFTGQNIQDTYQRVLQLSSSGELADGTGSVVPLLLVTASYAISASHEITTEISSSHAISADSASYILADNIDQPFNTITALGNISSSGDLFGHNLTLTTAATVLRLVVDQIDEYNSGEGISIMHSITASNNISASGYIYADHYYSNGGLIARDSGTTTYYGNNKQTEIDGTNIKLDAPVSASIISASTYIGTSASITNIYNTSLTSSIISSSGYIHTPEIRGHGIGTTQLHVQGHISASGDISASGILYANKLTSPSSLMLTTSDLYVKGGSLRTDPFHYITTGNITSSGFNSAQGNISASGDIISSKFVLNNDTVTGVSLTNPSAGTFNIKAGDGGALDVVGFKSIKTTFETTVHTQISASGNISASGDIINTGNLTTGQITASGDIDAQGYKSGGNYAAIWNGSSMVLGTYQQPATIRSSELELNQGNLTLTSTNGHISASGNISASGYIYAGGDIHAIGDVVASSTTPSDYRLKENIKPIDSPLEKVLNLDGKSFNWKKDQTPDFGLIAQDVEKIIPQLVKNKNILGAEETYKVVNYISIIPLLIESIKELNNKIEEIKHG